MATAVLAEGEKLFVRSEAVLRVCGKLGGAWRLLAWLRLIPRPLRDAGYDWIAARRRRFPLPRPEPGRALSAEERGRFLP